MCSIVNDDVAPTITLIKEVVGGTAEVGDFSLYLGGNSVTSGVATTVFANTPYDIDEDGPSGYSFTSLTGDPECPGVLRGDVEADEGENITCTITNTRDTGTIIVHKIIDADGIIEGEGADADQTPGENWEMDVDGNDEDTSDPISQNTDSNGDTTFDPLNTGSYDVTETLQDGYDLVDAFCEGENGSSDGETIYAVELGTNDTVECTFLNSPNGSIHGQKWNDLDGNGEKDENEEFLSGWRIFIDENENQTWDEGEEYVFTDSGEELGWYWFEHLFPGTYTVCEETQDGWAQTSSPICHTVELPNGPNTCTSPEQLNVVFGETCDFGNQFVNPDLLITKTNNTGGADQSPGGNVTFTITVTATESAVLDAVVTDLPSLGFTYRPGSWSATKNGLPFAIPEPVYASPGTWNLGDMAEDDEIVLTYIADISSSIQNGLYRDLAWAAGTNILSEEVVANDETGVFVGTDVSVVKTDVSGASINVITEGEVLGASTELPATGASTLWLAIAGLLALAGVTFMILGIRRLHA